MKHTMPILALLLPAVQATADEAASGPEPAVFPPEALIQWEERSFAGETDYSLVEKDGVTAVRARCDDTASGLFLERTIDLEETPVLEWRWRVDEIPRVDSDETTRQGDDFALRVYAVVDGGWLPWRSRAVSYVWTRQMAPGDNWANPWVEQVRMLSLARGTASSGQWVTERRNLRDDFRLFHDRTPTKLDGLAIMTDCDNTGTTREAWYGTLRFVPASSGPAGGRQAPML